MVTLNINKHYNFSVYANSVLGTNFRNAKLVSILDHKTALRFGNIDLLQKQVYPYLPPNTLADHTKYTYYLFTYNEKTVVIADAWINLDSVVETGAQNFTISLTNISTPQLNIIRNQLSLIGVSFEIT